jgi:hypothetical protein
MKWDICGLGLIKELYGFGEYELYQMDFKKIGSRSVANKIKLM